MHPRSQVSRVVAALVALAAAGCRTAPAGSQHIDPALAPLIPADTVALAGVRMEALRSTPLYRTWVAGKPVPQMDDFARQTGIDLRKDIWELLVASDGSDGVVMARGKFSTGGEEPRLGPPGARRMPYKGYTLIGDDQSVITFINSGTAVAGLPASVRSVIDQRERSSGPPARLLALVRSIPPSSQLWAASLGGFSQLESAIPPGNLGANLGKFFAMIETITLAGDLRSGLAATASAVCRTEQDANTLSTTVRGLIGLGRLTTPNTQPEMLRLYDTLEVEQQQRTLHLRAKIPQDLLDGLIGRFKGAS